MDGAPPDAKGKRVYGAGRVAFLAQQEEINRQIKEGWPLSEIYRRLRPPMAYSRFTAYVRRYIRCDDGDTRSEQPRTRETSTTAHRMEEKSATQPRTADVKLPTFPHDATPDEKKLI